MINREGIADNLRRIEELEGQVAELGALVRELTERGGASAAAWARFSLFARIAWRSTAHTSAGREAVKPLACCF